MERFLLFEEQIVLWLTSMIGPIDCFKLKLKTAACGNQCGKRRRRKGFTEAPNNDHTSSSRVREFEVSDLTEAPTFGKKRDFEISDLAGAR